MEYFNKEFYRDLVVNNRPISYESNICSGRVRVRSVSSLNFNLVNLNSQSIYGIFPLILQERDTEYWQKQLCSNFQVEKKIK